MAEFDEIKVGNLYRMSGDRYFMLLSFVKKENIIAVTVYNNPLVAGDKKKGIRPNSERTTESIRLDDTFLNCEIFILGETKPQGRKTTVAQFWVAYDCVAELPPETTI